MKEVTRRKATKAEVTQPDPAPLPAQAPTDAATDAPASPPAGDRRRAPAAETRQRILAVALELFTDRGYVKTSLREVAERLGFTTAALYYHFESKDEILAALVEDYFGAPSPVDRLAGRDDVDLATWAGVIDDLIAHLLGQRKLFFMVERNQAALEQLARSKATLSSHRQREELFRRIMANPKLPAADRVRIGCSLGAVMGLVMHCGEAFDDLGDDEFHALVAAAVHDTLGAG